MKKIFILISFTFVLGLFLFVSCGKKSTKPDQSNDQNQSIFKNVLVEDFEDTNGWTLDEGDSFELNTLHAREGDQSLKLNSVNGVAVGIVKTINMDLSGAKNFIFWLYVHDSLDKPGYIMIYFSSVMGWAKYFVGTIYMSQVKRSWNRLVISVDEFQTVGGESWSNKMITLKIRHCAMSGENSSLSIDDLRYNYSGKAKCIVTFDDGQESVYTKAKPIMDGNGQAGVAFVITDLIDTGGKLNKAQLDTLRDAGWDISNHTKTHPDLTTLGSEDLETEVNGAYDWLVNNGFGASAIFLSYPYGAYNDTVITKVKENHVIARCTHQSLFQTHFSLNDDNIDMLVKCNSVSNTITVETVQGWIDKKIQQGGLLVLLFHIIVDENADVGTKCLTADFKEISDYLRNKNSEIDVITFTDYYNGISEWE